MAGGCRRVDTTPIVKFGEDEGCVEAEKSLAISTPCGVREMAEKIEWLVARMSQLLNVGGPCKPLIKKQPQETGLLHNADPGGPERKRGDRGNGSPPMKEEGDGLRFRETEAMEVGPVDH